MGQLYSILVNFVAYAQGTSITYDQSVILDLYNCGCFYIPIYPLGGCGYTKKDPNLSYIKC